MRIINDAPWKSASRVVTDDQSALCWVKWNPKLLVGEDGSTVTTAATMQVQTSLVNFLVNGVADTTIGTYTSNSGNDDQIPFADAATVQGLLDRINSTEVGVRRYIAGLGDFRPGFVIGTGDGLVAAATNIMLGHYHDGLAVFGDSSGLATANLMGAAIGTPRAREGKGQQIPDHRESGYTSTTAGVITKVREPERSREVYPFTTTFETRLTGIHFAAAYATNAKLVQVYDQDDTLLYQETIGSANVLAADERYSFDNPIVAAQGPLFVEASGTGALTDGPLTIQGFIRGA